MPAGPPPRIVGRGRSRQLPWLLYEKNLHITLDPSDLYIYTRSIRSLDPNVKMHDSPPGGVGGGLLIPCSSHHVDEARSPKAVAQRAASREENRADSIALKLFVSWFYVVKISYRSRYMPGEISRYRPGSRDPHSGFYLLSDIIVPIRLHS